MLQDGVQICNIVNAYFVQYVFMFSLNKYQPILRIFLNECFSNLNLKVMSRLAIQAFFN